MGTTRNPQGTPGDLTDPPSPPRSADESWVHAGPQAKPDLRPTSPQPQSSPQPRPWNESPASGICWFDLGAGNSVLLLLNVHVFPGLPAFSLFGVSNFIPLLSKNILGIISSRFNLLRLVGGPSWGMFMCILLLLGGVF